MVPQDYLVVHMEQMGVGVVMVFLVDQEVMVLVVQMLQKLVM